MRRVLTISIDFTNDPEVSCATDRNQAYTQEDKADEREKIHFCDVAFELPLAASDIDCGSLDTYPSEKMDTFSRVALHEMLHYSTVGPPSLVGGQIVDQKNEDGKYAYGPVRAYGLNDRDQDEQPEKAESNADSYAWMALDGWISYSCSPDENWDSHFPDAPPLYKDY